MHEIVNIVRSTLPEVFHRSEEGVVKVQIPVLLASDTNLSAVGVLHRGKVGSGEMS
jgi:hypothetical protein